MTLSVEAFATIKASSASLSLLSKEFFSSIACASLSPEAFNADSYSLSDASLLWPAFSSSLSLVSSPMALAPDSWALAVASSAWLRASAAFLPSSSSLAFISAAALIPAS